MKPLLFNKQQETRRLLADCCWSPECSESNFIWSAFPLWGGQQIKHPSALWQPKMMLVWNIKNLNNPNDMVGYGHSSWGKPWNDDINLRERGRVTHTHTQCLCLVMLQHNVHYSVWFLEGFAISEAFKISLVVRCIICSPSNPWNKPSAVCLCLAFVSAWRLGQSSDDGCVAAGLLNTSESTGEVRRWDPADALHLLSLN